MIAAGVTAKTHVWKSASVVELSPNVLYGVIALGALITLVSFLGCCGACSHVKGALRVYFVLVALLLCGQIFVVVYANFHTDLGQDVWNGLSDEDRRTVQDDLTCCGFDQTVTPALRDQLQCPDDATQNCETVLEDRLKKYRKIIITVVVMTGLLQVLSLIASAWLIRSITQAKRRGTAHHDFLHDAGAYQNFQDERPAVPATQHQPQQQGGLYPNMR
eukprot:TRINITY_DN410_c0_g1_i3.p1 TRINITY_DN410_c0_g1~~TRINITY_DN410_c0_g1_i3.p1  ORF type:complete len:218 (-),score=52.78 TRINITY_DN410_c0_g1_i3:322-975(-)